MGKVISSLFGGGDQGPSKAEKEMQAERYRTANRAEAEEDQRVALAGRSQSLRKSLAYRDQSKSQTLGV